MSDFEYEDKSGYPIFVTLIGILVTIGVGALIVFLVIIPSLNDYNKDLPVNNEHTKSYLIIEQSVEKTLSDENISCETIIKLRQQHIITKNWWEDPLGSDSNFDTARDLYNAKSCGTHWGWFES